jgi:NADH-quinone oxidoreductase subunit J
MGISHVLFILFSVLILGGGVMVVTRRNLVQAAGALILTLFGVAGLYVLLEAGFLAAVQILIYIGAIAILIIFAVMLTRRLADEQEPGLNSQWAWALGTAVMALAILVIVIQGTWPLAGGVVGNAPPLTGDSTSRLGVALLSPEQYAFPFEVASVLLLSAMLGAIVIAREKRH